MTWRAMPKSHPENSVRIAAPGNPAERPVEDLLGYLLGSMRIRHPTGGVVVNPLDVAPVKMREGSGISLPSCLDQLGNALLWRVSAAICNGRTGPHSPRHSIRSFSVLHDASSSGVGEIANVSHQRRRRDRRLIGMGFGGLPKLGLKMRTLLPIGTQVHTRSSVKNGSLTRRNGSSLRAEP